MAWGMEAKEPWQNHHNPSCPTVYPERKSLYEENFSLVFLVKIEVNESWCKIVSFAYNQSVLIVELISVCRIEFQFSSLKSLYAETMYRNWEKYIQMEL